MYTSCKEEPVFGLLSPKPRKMRGLKPASRLFSRTISTITAHSCAVSPFTSPNGKNTERTHSPRRMTDYRTANKGVNSEKPHSLVWLRSSPSSSKRAALQSWCPSIGRQPRTKILHFVERSDRLQKYKPVNPRSCAHRVVRAQLPFGLNSLDCERSSTCRTN
jgi:hypothetical protein